LLCCSLALLISTWVLLALSLVEPPAKVQEKKRKNIYIDCTVWSGGHSRMAGGSSSESARRKKKRKNIYFDCTVWSGGHSRMAEEDKKRKRAERFGLSVDEAKSTLVDSR